MTNKTIPGNINSLSIEECRNKITAESISILQDIAWKTLNIGQRSNHEAVLFCIQVDDVKFKSFVDALMPDTDWKQYRDAESEPVALGSTTWNFCEAVAMCLPTISDLVMNKPAEDKFKLIVLAYGGCTIYEIDPVPILKQRH